jgi:hypothetical protein
MPDGLRLTLGESAIQRNKSRVDIREVGNTNQWGNKRDSDMIVRLVVNGGWATQN